MTVLSRPIRFCKFLDVLTMHYFNDKTYFLMQNFAHYTLRHTKIDPMSRKSMLEQYIRDKKWRPDIMKKLWGYGIRGKIYKWVNEFLTNRTQKVVVDGKKSDSKPVTSGVPQGSVLGPILFVIYINDLPDVIQCFIKLFADDSKLYRRVSKIEHVEILQSCLNRTVTWADIWEMFLTSSSVTIYI